MSSEQIKGTRFSQEQIESILSEIPDAESITALAKKHGVSVSTINRWRRKQCQTAGEESESTTPPTVETDVEDASAVDYPKAYVFLPAAALIAVVSVAKLAFKWKSSRKAKATIASLPEDIKRAA